MSDLSCMGVIRALHYQLPILDGDSICAQALDPHHHVLLVWGGRGAWSCCRGLHWCWCWCGLLWGRCNRFRLDWCHVWSHWNVGVSLYSVGLGRRRAGGYVGLGKQGGLAWSGLGGNKSRLSWQWGASTKYFGAWPRLDGGSGLSKDLKLRIHNIQRRN